MTLAILSNLSMGAGEIGLAPGPGDPGQQSVTVIGGGAPGFTISQGVPLVEFRESWSDPWTWDPTFEVARVSRNAASGGFDVAELRRRYGLVMEKWDTSASHRDPLVVFRAWVRISLPDGNGTRTVFVGQITSDTRQIHRDGDASGELSGTQTFTCAGPLRILDRAKVDRAFWDRGAIDIQELGWPSTFNRRDERGIEVGNRSAAKDGDSYTFGGTELWTHLEAIEYLVDRFAQETNGPAWRVGDVTGVLAELQTTVGVPRDSTVASIIRKLAPREWGLDYVVYYYEDRDGTGQVVEDGFAVEVYSLIGEDVSFGDVSLPENPRKVRIDEPWPGGLIEATVEISADHAYETIRVVGERIVVCGSLWGAHYGEFGTATSIVPRWPANIEAAYKAGTGTPGDSAEEHDAARGADLFRLVYQAFGAPDDWNLLTGELTDLQSFAIRQDASGDIVTDADYQTTERATLPWLPLREGYDYSVAPAVPVGALGAYVPDLLPPGVWVSEDGEKLIPAESAGVSVSVSGTDWGVFLQSSPNHRLAKNHMDGGDAPTLVDPVIDHERMIATIAFRADHRVGLEWTSPLSGVGQGYAGGESVQVIEAPGAELWYVLPETVFQVSESGGLYRTPEEAIIVRNDTPRLALVMAGAIARYYEYRWRARLTFRGWWPIELIGWILSSIETGGQLYPVSSPVTSIEYVNDAETGPRTIIKAGSAQ